MTAMQISGSERDTLRVLALDLPDEAVERFVTEAGTGEWPLRAALGAARLRPEFVDVVRIRDLGAMPLSDYLMQAHGVREAEIAPMKARLDALEGHVVLLPAQAFDATRQEITVAAPLRWIGTFGEERAAAAGPALRSASARGTASEKKPASDAAMSGRIAALALLVMFLLVAVLVWIAA